MDKVGDQTDRTKTEQIIDWQFIDSDSSGEEKGRRWKIENSKVLSFINRMEVRKTWDFTRSDTPEKK